MDPRTFVNLITDQCKAGDVQGADSALCKAEELGPPEALNHETCPDNPYDGAWECGRCWAKVFEPVQDMLGELVMPIIEPIFKRIKASKDPIAQCDAELAKLDEKHVATRHIKILKALMKGECDE